MNKKLYLDAAYAVTWLIHLVYVVFLTGKAKRLRREADELARR